MKRKSLNQPIITDNDKQVAAKFFNDFGLQCTIKDDSMHKITHIRANIKIKDERISEKFKK